MKNDLLKAIELALAGEWDPAHSIVQEAEGNTTAAWIHAVLHKIEGDTANSRYWYGHAGRQENLSAEPRRELEQIKKELLERAATTPSAA